MSDHGGIRTQRRRVLFVLTALLIPLAGCEYDGPAEGRAPSSERATEPARTLAENIGEVARLLAASSTDPGMPSEAEPAGKLSLVAPGTMTVTSACAGAYGAKLTIVIGDEGLPGGNGVHLRRHAGTIPQAHRRPHHHQRGPGNRESGSSRSHPEAQHQPARFSAGRFGRVGLAAAEVRAAGRGAWLHCVGFSHRLRDVCRTWHLRTALPLRGTTQGRVVRIHLGGRRSSRPSSG